jgi:hypothetical protein
MMVLMSCERRSAGEGFLTVREGTLVRSFPRMYAAMPCKRTRITKRLRVTISAPCEKDAKTKDTFPQRSHMCGFSPVCTRACTVRADL